MTESAVQPLPREVTDAAAMWFARRDVGGFSAKDQHAFDLWLQADPAHERAWASLNRLWGSLEAAPPELHTVARDPVDAWQGQRARRKRRIAAGSAACLAVLAVAQWSDLAIRMQADAITATGERREMRLADGSVVHLNTGTAIAVDYGAARRTVRLLKGEAAFDVAKDRARPFVVEAAGGDATALGTRYLVRAEGGGALVTVTQHSVAVRNRAGASAVVVREGQSLHYTSEGVHRPAAGDTWTATGWMRGKLVFENRPLGEVVAEIDRYHSGMIRVIGSKVAALRISGVFPVDDPLAAIADIERSLGLHSTRVTDRAIFIHD